MKLSILCVLYLFGVCRGQFISGGSDALISEYPFAASLLYSSGTGAQFQYACGGSILSTTAILSAASCFYDRNTPTQWQARVGSSNANSGGTIHNLIRITIHPDFQFTTKDNDIAIVRTNPAFTLQPGVVELAKIAVSSFTFERNHRVKAIGWGSARDSTGAGELRHVQTFAIDQDVCAIRYEENGIITDNMVCVGWLDVGVHGQCSEGGFGSPVVVKGVVVGIYSWSQGCATLRHPHINTRISPYWRWIVTVGTESLPSVNINDNNIEDKSDVTI